MKSETMPTLPALKQPDGKVMVETEDLMKHFATMGGKLVVRRPVVLHQTRAPVARQSFVLCEIQNACARLRLWV